MLGVDLAMTTTEQMPIPGKHENGTPWDGRQCDGNLTNIPERFSIRIAGDNDQTFEESGRGRAHRKVSKRWHLEPMQT